MHSKAMIVVGDVEASSAWYQRLLGATSGHGGPDFEMLMGGDELLLMLHHKETEEHPAIGSHDEGGTGGGVLLYFYLDDVDAAYERAIELSADVSDAPHVNEQARQYEFSLRDPDGYALTIARIV